MKKNNDRKKLSQQVPLLLVGLAITFIMVGIYLSGLLTFFEKISEDWRIKAFRHDPHPSIAVIAISEDDMKKFGKWPWKRGIHAELLEKVSAQSPKVIGMDIIFSDPDPGDPDGNRRLNAITKKAGNVIFPVWADPKVLEADKGKVTNEGGAFLMPLQEVGENCAGVGHDNVMPDVDNKVRSMVLKIYSGQFAVESFPLAAAKMFLDIPDEGETRGNQYTFGDTVIPVSDMGGMYIAFAGPPGTFKSYSYTDVIDGRVPNDAFKDKIVLIGSNVPGMGNFSGFPLDSILISQVELFANTVDTLLYKTFFRQVSSVYNIIIIIVLGLLATWIFSKSNFIRNVMVLVVVIALYLALAYLLSLKTRYLANMTVPVFTIALCFVGNLAYSMISERKERMKITQTFGRYVAPQVVDEILRTGDNLLAMEGKMQYVSVLFVDVSGFTTMSEKMSPIQIVRILNRYFKEVIEVVYLYEGTVDKFIGDAVMVVFNAPLPIERHEEKAVRAGLEIQKRIAAISGDIEKEFGMPLGASLGINSGEAIIGNIGALNRVEYATIGDTVNAAARLQSLAGRSHIYISGTTYEPIKDIVEVDYIGPQKVKGKAEQIEVYDVLGFKS